MRKESPWRFPQFPRFREGGHGKKPGVWWSASLTAAPTSPGRRVRGPREPAEVLRRSPSPLDLTPQLLPPRGGSSPSAAGLKGGRRGEP